MYLSETAVYNNLNNHAYSGEVRSIVKNKKILVVFTSLLMFLCIFFSFSIYQVWAKECWLWTCAPNRTFSVFDLRLPNHMLPEDAIVQPIIPPSDPSGVESGNMSFFWHESGELYGGGLDVDRYGTVTRAEKMFENNLYWRSRGSYEAHPDITFESTIADEFVIGCGSSVFDTGYDCRFAARYQEYVVSFSSYIGKQMSESQFEQIVIDIDHFTFR